MIAVKYIYSACVVITTPTVRILCDPWFTEGIYDGSWFHYPEVTNPLESIGNVDLIYISHLHPDHYDPVFLKQYFAKYGGRPVLIANHEPNYLAQKMLSDGIRPMVLAQELIFCRSNIKKQTCIKILPHKTGSISDIDSVLIVQHDGHCVVNTNDVIFDDAMMQKVKQESGEIDILLCGYTGAGPYPQTYFDLTDPAIMTVANSKKWEFFRRYRELTAFMDAKINIPFAGKYLLGGLHARLNYYRGVADPVEVLSFDKKAVVLGDNGGEINTIDLRPTITRTEKYTESDMDRRINEIARYELDYQRLIRHDEIYQLPLKRLISIACKNALQRSECDEDYYFCITLPDDEYAVINAKRHTTSPRYQPLFCGKDIELPTPRSEIIIDPRYLFGLLTHVYHWNNAEVGSQYLTRRKPDVLNRKAQNFLNFLTV